ncbi:hypothetical protein [Acinetobacter sp. TUM15071]|uniref:hypothetical protein n=1 Tax=Acinetobacter sp. TUM15071 TaxID=2609135 RepID=UPI00124DEC8E|nr:hypothetical protein [Acinetobacter sp. TUM15071]
MLEKDPNKLSQVIYSSQNYKDWHKIAQASKQCEADDVAQDAFLFIIEHWNGEFNLANDEHWNELKHKMWNKFVHGADRILKNAFDFDQSTRNDLDEAINPILLTISSPTSTEPLQRMLDAEDQHIQQNKETHQIKENSFSMALAYVHLFESLKPKLIKYTYLSIADYMKMSYSWLRQCLKRAEKLQKIQHSLFDNLEYAPVQHLGSWRKFKLEKRTQAKFTPTIVNQLNLFQQRF